MGRYLIFRRITWCAWILAHLIAIPLFLRLRWSSPEEPARWLALGSVVFALVFALSSRELDLAYDLGGILSIRRWLELDRRRHDAAVTNSQEWVESETETTLRRPLSAVPEDTERLRTGLDKERVSITTGFSAILGFQVVGRFAEYRDLSHQVLLVMLAVFFVLVCLSNLVELGLYTLVGQAIWDQTQKNGFRYRLRFLTALSSQLLVIAVIALLALLPYPWTYACVLVNFLYGTAHVWVYFSVEPPQEFPNT